MLKFKIDKFNKTSVVVLIENSDLFFTEKIIKQNIKIEKLNYELSVNDIDSLHNIIKTKFIPFYHKKENTKQVKMKFTFDDIKVEINDLDYDRVYRLIVNLYEEFEYSGDIIHNTSKSILFSPQHGELTEKKINQLNRHHRNKKIFCQSEKEVIGELNIELENGELLNILSKKDIKSLTLENRGYSDGVNSFFNSKNKYSKLPCEKRNKKVLYSTKAQLYFDDKMLKNNILPKKNPFMKNEWYMGGIYSYDNNYKQYI